MVKVGINGFGRIGRLVFRALGRGGGPQQQAGQTQDGRELVEGLHALYMAGSSTLRMLKRRRCQALKARRGWVMLAM